MDQLTASRIVEENRRLHEAPGYAARYNQACGIMAHPWEQTVFERDVRDVHTLLGSPEGKRVLDVGCGTGSLSLRFLERGFFVVGLDLAAAMLGQLRAKAAERGLLGLLTTQEATADEYLGASGEAFDAIVFSAVLHHLPNYLDTLRLAAGRTRVGGVIYIVHEPSLSSRVGFVSKALEVLDRSMAELPGFLRRQLEDMRRQGVVTCVSRKLRRRLFRGPLPQETAKKPAADDAVDWALVDYHSKHGGCDEEAIATLLRQEGFAVGLRRYDSKRHRVFHLLAKLLRTERMLRVVAIRQR